MGGVGRMAPIIDRGAQPLGQADPAINGLICFDLSTIGTHFS
jgi:hypothetical protein